MCNLFIDVDGRDVEYYVGANHQLATRWRAVSCRDYESLAVRAHRDYSLERRDLRSVAMPTEEPAFKEFVEALRNEDPEAFARFNRDYVSKLPPILQENIAKRLQSKFAGSDVANSAFRGFIRALAKKNSNDEPKYTFDNEAKLSAFLYAIADKKLKEKIRHYKTAKRDVRREQPLDGLSTRSGDDSHSIDPMDSDGKSPDAIAEANDGFDELMEVMESLSSLEQKMLAMQFDDKEHLGDKSWNAVAKVLGCSEAEARFHFKNLVIKLRKLLME